MNGNSGTLLGAIVSPILLIALGSLIALDTYLDIGFGRTWPVLIILFGVLKLVQRLAGPQVVEQQYYGHATPYGMAAATAPPPPPPPAATTVVETQAERQEGETR